MKFHNPCLDLFEDLADPYFFSSGSTHFTSRHATGERLGAMIVARNAQIALPPPYSTLQMTDSSLNDIGAQSPRTLFTEIEDALRKQNNDDHGAPCTNQGLISNKLALGTNNMSNARDQIFQLASMVGNLCTLFLSVPHDPIQSATERPSPDDDPFWLESSPSPEKDRVANQLGQVFVHMFATAGTCGVDLCTSILKKVELNGRKYPVELCKVCGNDKMF